MIEIPLTKGYVAIVDDEDADLAEYKWRVLVHSNTNYAMRSIKKDGRSASMMFHRVLMEKVIGRPLEKLEVVDHIDGDGLNNLRSNVRLCTYSQNNMNKHKHKQPIAGMKGITRLKTKKEGWQAQIKINGKNVYLGVFPTAEEAYKAYCKVAIELHGEFWRAA